MTENELKISAHTNHQKIFEFILSCNTADIDTYIEILLASIEKKCTEKKINNIQWPLDDEIFNYISMQKIKDKGEKILKQVTIHLDPRVKVINSRTAKDIILSKYHIDPLFGGHVGQNKLYAKLRSLFYWKNMQKDIAKFINECNKCKINKPKNKILQILQIT